jgi:polysaccharide pyruvyl transferase WcaK-like protein
MTMLRHGLNLNAIGVAATCPVGQDFGTWPGLMKHIERADVVIINAEGTIHHTASRPKARNLAAAAWRIKELRAVPVVMVNASIEALEKEDLPGLRACDAIYVREAASLSYLAQLRIEANLAADLTLAEAIVARAATRHGLFVTDSVLPKATADLRAAARRLRGGFRTMRPSKLWAYPSYFAYPHLLDLYGRGFLRSIAEAEQVLTGRFHAMLFCMALETPFLAMDSNSSKVSAVLQDALGSTSRQISSLDGMNSTGQILPFSDDELVKLRHYRNQAAIRIREMFHRIGSLAESGKA